MITRRSLAATAVLAAAALATWPRSLPAAGEERRLLYVASPGVRNYVEYGGVGLLVFDIANGHRFVKRIPTFPEVAGKEPENVKGIVASARTGRLYVSTPQRLGAFDLVTERMLWSRTYEGGCDRMAISPDGKQLYVPSFEGPHWTVVDGATGNVVGTVVTNSGAHNTIYGPGGRLAYLAGLKSPMLNVADAATRRVVKQVGPFGNAIRPFTVNGSETLVFVNVNALLGFEVGDLQTGRVLHRVEVDGYKQGPVKRHGCPSHGIGLTPDEKELWLADGANESVHVFDATVMPPRTDRQHQAARPAGMGDLQHRRPIRVPLDGRGHRHAHAQDRGHARRRDGPGRAEREAPGDRVLRRPPRPRRRPVRRGRPAVVRSAGEATVQVASCAGARTRVRYP